MFDFLFEMFQQCRWQVFHFVLGIEMKQQNLAFGGDVVIDEPEAAALAASTACPAEFTQTAAAWNDGSGIRSLHQGYLESEVILIISEQTDVAGEMAELHKFHDTTMRRWRMDDNGFSRQCSPLITLSCKSTAPVLFRGND